MEENSQSWMDTYDREIASLPSITTKISSNEKGGGDGEGDPKFSRWKR